VVASIGYGLTTLLEPDSSAAEWIGYQIIIGIGVGAGFQQPLMAVQTVLVILDIPTGTAVIVFLQTLGGALFVSVAQNIFANKLVHYVAKYVPELGDAYFVLAVGATNVKEVVPSEFLPDVKQAFNDALTQTSVLFAALAATSILGAAFVEWKSVRGKKVEMVAA
jgi:hypothetical protein